MTLESPVVGYVEEAVSQFELRVRVCTPGFTVYLNLGRGAVHCVPHSAVSSVNKVDIN